MSSLIRYSDYAPLDGRPVYGQVSTCMLNECRHAALEARRFLLEFEGDDVDDTSCRVTVPFLRRMILWAFVHLPFDRCPYFLGLCPRQCICPFGDCDGPFCVVSHSNAPDAEARSFFLNST